MAQTKNNTLNLDFFEILLVANSLVDKEYMSSIVDYVDPKFFADKNKGKIFAILADFFVEHNQLPTAAEIKSRLATEADNKAWSAVVAGLKDIDLDLISKPELLKNTERYIKERYLYNTILEVAEAYSPGKSLPNVAETLDKLEKAYTISLAENLGSFYFDEIEKHVNELHTSYNAIPLGWSCFDVKTEGGVYPKTLTVFAGQVNVGKSIILGNIAANLVLSGKNVLLLTLEMSEFMYAKRLDAKFTGIPQKDLKAYSDELIKQIKTIQSKTPSNLVIKEFAPKSITVRQIHGLLSKLQRSKGFVPDVIVVDYINLIQPSTKGLNSYESVKEIAEQLRALAVKYSIPVISATQLRRSGFNSTHPGMDEVAECIEVNQCVTLRDGTTKKIKDVIFGDQLMAHDGYRTVTQVHHPKIKKCFKITLRSGKEIIVSEKHKFPTSRGRLSISDGLCIGDKLNTSSECPSVVIKKHLKQIYASVKVILKNIFRGGVDKNSI